MVLKTLPSSSSETSCSYRGSDISQIVRRPLCTEVWTRSLYFVHWHFTKSFDVFCLNVTCFVQKILLRSTIRIRWTWFPTNPPLQYPFRFTLNDSNPHIIGPTSELTLPSSSFSVSLISLSYVFSEISDGIYVPIYAFPLCTSCLSTLSRVFSTNWSCGRFSANSVRIWLRKEWLCWCQSYSFSFCKVWDTCLSLWYSAADFSGIVAFIAGCPWYGILL